MTTKENMKENNIFKISSVSKEEFLPIRMEKELHEMEESHSTGPIVPKIKFKPIRMLQGLSETTESPKTSATKIKFKPIRMLQGLNEKEELPKTSLAPKIKFMPIRMFDGLNDTEEIPKTSLAPKIKFMPIRMLNVGNKMEESPKVSLASEIKFKSLRMTKANTEEENSPKLPTSRIKFLPVRLTEEDLRPESHKNTKIVQSGIKFKKNFIKHNTRHTYGQTHSARVSKVNGSKPNFGTSVKMSCKKSITQNVSETATRISQLNMNNEVDAHKKHYRRNLFSSYDKNLSRISEETKSYLPKPTSSQKKKCAINCSGTESKTILNKKLEKKMCIDAACQTDLEYHLHLTNNTKAVTSVHTNTESYICCCANCPNNKLINKGMTPVIDQKHNNSFEKVVSNQNFGSDRDSSLTEFVQFEFLVQSPKISHILTRSTKLYSLNNKTNGEKILETNSLPITECQNIYSGENKENDRLSNNCLTRSPLMKNQIALNLYDTPNNLTNTNLIENNTITCETPNVFKKERTFNDQGKKEIKAKKVLKMYAEMKSCNPSVLETPQVNWKQHGKITFLNNESKLSRVLLSQIEDIISTPRK